MLVTFRLSVPDGVNVCDGDAPVTARRAPREPTHRHRRAGRTVELAATTLGWAAAVVSLRGDVLNGGHLKAGGRQRTDGGVTA